MVARIWNWKKKIEQDTGIVVFHSFSSEKKKFWIKIYEKKKIVQHKFNITLYSVLQLIYHKYINLRGSYYVNTISVVFELVII